jgi:hypothetical protein
VGESESQSKVVFYLKLNVAVLAPVCGRRMHRTALAHQVVKAWLRQTRALV